MVGFEFEDLPDKVAGTVISISITMLGKDEDWMSSDCRPVGLIIDMHDLFYHLN